MELPVITEMEVKESPEQECWRLVWFNGKVTDLHLGTGKTKAINLFCATTKLECLDKIAELGLEPLKDQVGEESQKTGN
jgi:hypothetical protein